MHDFKVTSFTSPTFCEYCSGFIWGLTRQGVRCSKCKATAHSSCAVSPSTNCQNDRGLATLVRNSNTPVPSNHGSGRAVGGTSMETLHHQRGSPSSSLATSSSVFGMGGKGNSGQIFKHLDRVYWQKVEEETKLNDNVSAQTEQPLSLFQTLPTNFMQFTAKLAPLSIVHRGIQDILLWRRPKHSVVAMLVYSLYCLRPNLLVATPLALAIAYIIFNFFNSGYADFCLDDTSTTVNQWADDNSKDQHGRVQSPAASPLRLPFGFSSASTSPTISEASSANMAAATVSSAVVAGGNERHGSNKMRSRRRSQPSASPPSSAPYPKMLAGSNTFNSGSSTSKNSFMDRDSRAAAHATQATTTTQEGSNDNNSSNTQKQPKSRRALTRSKMEQNQRVNLQALLGVASFGSAKYTENVHTTQTLTGTYVGVFDWIAAHNHLVDWSQPEQTQQILMMCIWIQLALLIVVYMVPWHLLFLVSGNVGLLSMSPHVRAFVKIYGIEAALYIHGRAMQWLVQQRLRLARIPLLGRPFRYADHRQQQHFDCDEDDADYGEGSGYRTPPLLSMSSSTAGSSTLTLMRRPHVVSVFENQRWWLGFGWIPRLGTNERAKWSDESGQTRYASVKDFMPEEGYEWADEDNGWEVDRFWALPVVHTDDDGWVYTDNFWRRPASTSSALGSYTRRRKWVRKVRLAGPQRVLSVPPNSA